MITPGCVLEADDRWTPDAWRSRLELTVAGLPLLVRQLRCLRAGGFQRVTLVGSAWQQIAVPVVRGLEVERGPDGLSSLDQAGARWLTLAADTVLDVRLLRQFIRVASGCPDPLIAVDAFSTNPSLESKSPYHAGVPTPDDLQPADGKAGVHPIGLALTADPGRRPSGLDPLAGARRLAVGRYGWWRVADRAGARAAGWLVLLSTMKRDDGLYSRWNRRISLRMSRVLVATPLTANTATLLNAGCSVAGAVLMAAGTWSSAVAGSLVLLFTCIFDGVDGEIARARFEASSLGEHLDAVEGAIFYVALVAGLGAAVEATHPGRGVRELTAAGVVSAGVWASTTFIVSRLAVRHSTNADGLYRAKMFAGSIGPVRALLRSCSFAFKRAAAGWYLALGALAGVLPWLFVPVIAGTLLSGPIGIYIALLILGESPSSSSPEPTRSERVNPSAPG